MEEALIYFNYADENYQEHSETRNLIYQVYQDLKKTGFSVWMREEDLLVGQNISYEINKMINKSTFHLVFLSNAWNDRGNHVARFKRIKGKQKEFHQGEICIIPIKIEDCQVKSEEFQKTCKAKQLIHLKRKRH